jgi:hypothetical protein
MEWIEKSKGMASSEERLHILKMIQEGKLTAEQGAQLIEALEEIAGAGPAGSPTGFPGGTPGRSPGGHPGTPKPGPHPAEDAPPGVPAWEVARPETAGPGAGRSSRWFRVRVTDVQTGKTRVNLRLPVHLVQAGLKMGARFSPEVQSLDPDQLMKFIKSGEVGKLVDVVDDEDGEHVEVFIE